MTIPAPPATHDARSETDEALVARLAAKDEDALRELHRRHAALVFAVAARFVGNATAEEVVQDVFVTLWAKHAMFDPARGAFKPWLLQITRRRALNGLRRARNERSDGDEALSQVEAESVTPDDADWLAHRRAVIRAAVDALPEAQRQALSLAFFEELTHEQIARALGTPIGTAKTRIRLALKRLGPVLLAAAIAIVVVMVVRRRGEQEARNEEALRMVTTSDVVPLRLSPGPAAPPDAHGNYRTRPGATVAVLTTSHLAALAPGQNYVAWAHGPRGWQRLGQVVVEGDGRSLLVVEVQPNAPPPDELRVSRETNSTGSTPSEPALLEWNAVQSPPPRP
jgi:RNA polymerase sigma-70 factor (ECF subfamily)